MNDTALTVEQRGLLVWFGTRPGGWQYRVVDTLAETGFERKKYQRLFASLKAAGYVETEHRRDRLGRVTFTKLTLKNGPEGANHTPGKRQPRVQIETLRSEGANHTHTSSLDRTEKSPAKVDLKTVAVAGNA